MDLENYRHGFEGGWYLFWVLNSSPLDFIFGEGAWVLAFDALYRWAGDIETAFTLVSAAAVFLMSWYVIRRTGSPYYLLFFINPAFINLAIEQIRSGLATGFFFTAVITKNIPIKVALIALAASFHTAFFLLGAFYLGFFIFSKFAIGERLVARPIPAAVITGVVAIVFTTLRSTLLQYIGDERADLFVFADAISLCLAFCSFVVTYIVLAERRVFSVDTAFYTFCVTTALFSVFFGVYGVRFIGIAIPALAVMASEVSPRYRVFFVAQYVALSALYFWFWLQY